MWTEKVKSVKVISHSKDAGTSFHKLKFERTDSKTCAACSHRHKASDDSTGVRIKAKIKRTSSLVQFGLCLFKFLIKRQE